MKIIKAFVILSALVSISSCSKHSDPDEKLIIPPHADYIPTQK